MTPTEAWLRSQAIRAARTAKGLLAVAKRHLPKWMVVVIAVALAIPGPQDELLVMVIVGVWAAFKPAMRKDIAATTKEAWDIYAEEAMA